MDNFEESSLTHYGVKGMRWGFRKSTASSRASIKSSSRRNKNSSVGRKVLKGAAITTGVVAVTGATAVAGLGAILYPEGGIINNLRASTPDIASHFNFV